MRAVPARLLAVAASTALVLGLSTIPRSPAAAAIFAVNSTATAGDANPGNGVCATGAGVCTLRAAIEEANARPGSDIITIPAGTFPLAERIEITDDVQIRGLNAASTTITGENTSALFRIRTEEYLVCDATLDRIRSYHDNGTNNGLFVAAGSGGLDVPLSARIGRGDDVFVSGFGSGVHRYNGTNGANEGLFVASGSGGLSGPTDAVFGPSESGTSGSDDLYVTDFQPGGGILRYDGDDGSFDEEFVGAGDVGLAFANDLVFHGGDLYVTSAGSHQVLQFDGDTGAPVGDGVFVPAFSGGLSTPRGLMFAPDGSLLVASEDTNSILRYDGTTGAFLGTLVAPGSGGLDEPIDVALGHDGSLLVVSDGSDQVLRFDITTGAFQEVFIQGGNATLQSPSCILPRASIGAGPIVTISRVTLADGDANAISDAGAALITEPGSTTTISDSVVRDHSSNTLGGAISNFGRLTLLRSEVRDNTLPVGFGGGQTSTGGAVYNQGRLTVNQSTIAGNTANRGGGISNSGGGDLDVINSTISQNTAMGGGGGIRNAGSGSVVRISMSTITENEANVPGGGEGEDSRWGGGIQNFAPGGIALSGTIVAGNTDNRSSFDAEYSPDCYSPDEDQLLTFGFNVWGVVSNTCILRDPDSGFILPNELFGTEDDPLDAGLGTLSLNGGLTRTHALTATSPAIDFKAANSDNAFFDTPNRDQRNAVRPADGDGNAVAVADAGAYERNAVLLPPFVLQLPLALQVQLERALCPVRGSFCVPLTSLTSQEIRFLSSLSRTDLRRYASLPPRVMRQVLQHPLILVPVLHLNRHQVRLLLAIEPRRF